MTTESGDRDAPRPPRPPRKLPPRSVTIRCRLDGPLVVEVAPDVAALGVRLRLTDHEGNELPLPPDDRPPALCRCGASGTKPFCDGSHKAIRFAGGSPPPPDSDAG